MESAEPPMPTRVLHWASLATLGLFVGGTAAYARADEWTATVYAARISGERTWQHIITESFASEFVDAYLVTGAVSRAYAHLHNDALRLEAEAQLVYNFGDQHHWEINAVPIVARWQRFPWSESIATSAALGLGLSYAAEVPEVEVELEGESQAWLIYWGAELTAGPPTAPWSVTLRLHHRSNAWGLMSADGGMNAVGLGIRWQF